MEYPMKVYPIHFDDGRTEWCVEYPDLKGCVGGGDTVEEAIADAEISKQVYLECLKSEGIEAPVPTLETDLPSGKIALRVAKTTHKQLIENAKREGVSLNSYIQTAISEKIGRDSYSLKMFNMIKNIKHSVDEIRTGYNISEYQPIGLRSWNKEVPNSSKLKLKCFGA